MTDHSGHRDRLRREFLARPDSFPDHKLMELLLFYTVPRQDTNAIAHELLARFSTVANVMDAEPEALRQVPGVGDQTVAFLRVIKEVGRRYQAVRTSLSGIISRSREAAELLHPYFYGARNEMVYLLCLDGKNKVLACPKVGEGSINAAEVMTRKVVDAALRNNAAGVMLAHNHVSGLAIPSVEDQNTTSYLRDLLAQVGVTLLDHLIFVNDDMVSMKDSGFF